MRVRTTNEWVDLGPGGGYRHPSLRPIDPNDYEYRATFGAVEVYRWKLTSFDIEMEQGRLTRPQRSLGYHIGDMVQRDARDLKARVPVRPLRPGKAVERVYRKTRARWADYG